MRSRQALSSPQYYSRALSPPLSPRKPPRATAGQPPGLPSEEATRDQPSVTGSSSDVRDGSEPGSAGNSHGSRNGIETASRTPPEDSGDHSAVEAAGGKGDGSTVSPTKLVAGEGGEPGPRARRRTLSSRRRTQAAALESGPHTEPELSSSQELEAGNTPTARRTSSGEEHPQRTTPETTPQESKSESSPVGRDGPRSSQEDPSGGRRYSHELCALLMNSVVCLHPKLVPLLNFL